MFVSKSSVHLSFSFCNSSSNHLPAFSPSPLPLRIKTMFKPLQKFKKMLKNNKPSQKITLFWRYENSNLLRSSVEVMCMWLWFNNVLHVRRRPEEVNYLIDTDYGRSMLTSKFGICSFPLWKAVHRMFIQNLRSSFSLFTSMCYLFTERLDMYIWYHFVGLHWEIKCWNKTWEDIYIRKLKSLQG